MNEFYDFLLNEILTLILITCRLLQQTDYEAAEK